jgi:ubiquinone/menaquinone biosynthesis C-methylase UbiE
MPHVPPEAIAAANAYDNGLVPALMQEWAPRMVSAADIVPGHRVLDVACGTGVLARAAADAVGPTGSVTGLDLDPGMLAVARARRADIEWRPPGRLTPTEREKMIAGDLYDPFDPEPVTHVRVHAICV